jgi:alpha-tubulin suppressor-like RCC1 family protein
MSAACSLHAVQQLWPRIVLCLVATALVLPGGAVADQSSQPSAPAAGQISVGAAHSCAVLGSAVRCWGFGADGRLGIGSLTTVGDDETPGAVDPINFGPGSVVRAISAGTGHTCALLADATVHCWGFGDNGRLGYASTNNIPDAGAAGAVDVGGPVKAISAGDAHTCALRVDGGVVCWGFGGQGRLGYGGVAMADPITVGNDPPNIGDNETPAIAGTVALGGGPAIAITAGGSHTCALMATGEVRCWGVGALGALGYGNTRNIGDNETPVAAGVVNLGGHTATAIDAGANHTCAVLDDRSVRCWGFGFDGELGLGNRNTVGDVLTPAAVPSVDLGGATVKAISAGGQHTCAVLDDGSVRCWGRNQFGQLGYGTTTSIGDDETPASAGPVDLGPGRTAAAISTGITHTCALLDDGTVRCWGFGSNGRLGYCNETTIGDDELPSAAGPIDFSKTGAGCVVPTVPGPAVAAGPVGSPGAGVPTPDPAAREAARAKALKTCLRAATKRPARSRAAARRACLRRYGRTPSRVGALRARAVGATKVVLSFTAAGSDGKTDPAARSYLIRQSLRPLRVNRDLLRATALCRTSCRFPVTAVGQRVNLTVTGLKAHTTYYFAVAARDNVSGRLGPRAPTVRVRTR